MFRQLVHKRFLSLSKEMGSLDFYDCDGFSKPLNDQDAQRRSPDYDYESGDSLEYDEPEAEGAVENGDEHEEEGLSKADQIIRVSENNVKREEEIRKETGDSNATGQQGTYSTVRNGQIEAQLPNGVRHRYNLDGTQVSSQKAKGHDGYDGEIIEDGGFLYSQDGQLLEEAWSERGDNYETPEVDTEAIIQKGDSYEQYEADGEDLAVHQDLRKRKLAAMDAHRGISPSKRQKRYPLEELSPYPVDTSQGFPSSPPDHDFHSARSYPLSPPATRSRSTSIISNPTDDEDFSPFRRTTISLYLPLPPLCQNCPLEGIVAQHISPLLLTYYHPVRGVILSHSNPRFSTSPQNPAPPPSELFPQENAKATRYPPTYGRSLEHGPPMVWLTIDFTLFAPSPGNYMQGYLNLQNEDNIGLVCYNFFIAFIERKRFPSDWTWIPAHPPSPDTWTEPLKGGSDEDSEEVARRKRAWKRRRRSKSRRYHSPSSSSEDNDNGTRKKPAEAEEEEDGPAGHWLDSSGQTIGPDDQILFRIVSVDSSGGLPKDYSFMSVHGTLLPAEQEAEVSRVERLRGVEKWNHHIGVGGGAAKMRAVGMGRKGRGMQEGGVMPGNLSEGIREAELAGRRREEAGMTFLERRARQRDRGEL